MKRNILTMRGRLNVKLNKMSVIIAFEIMVDVWLLQIWELVDFFLSSAQQKAHTPFHDMLPHLHTIYNDVILLNVLTEV